MPYSLLSQNDGVTPEARVVRVSSVGIQNDMRVDDMCRAGRDIQLLLNNSAGSKQVVKKRGWEEVKATLFALHPEGA